MKQTRPPRAMQMGSFQGPDISLKSYDLNSSGQSATDARKRKKVGSSWLWYQRSNHWIMRTTTLSWKDMCTLITQSCKSEKPKHFCRIIVTAYPPVMVAELVDASFVCIHITQMSEPMGRGSHHAQLNQGQQILHSLWISNSPWKSPRPTIQPPLRDAAVLMDL
jgi:hypothetical protein